MLSPSFFHGGDLKLAEALVERKSLKDEIQDLWQGLGRVAKVQEGDEPVEQPLALLQAIESKLGKLEQLITQINRTNMAARLPDGRTLMEAIAEREMLRLQRGGHAGTRSVQPQGGLRPRGRGVGDLVPDLASEGGTPTLPSRICRADRQVILLQLVLPGSFVIHSAG